MTLPVVMELVFSCNYRLIDQVKNL